MRNLTVPALAAIIATSISVLLMAAPPHSVPTPQSGGLPALESRVAALEARVATLALLNISQSQEIAALEGRLETTEEKLGYVSVEGTDMFITGANLHILNGLGSTNGLPSDPTATNPSATAVNGLGNLIIGYNAELGSGGAKSRDGSHNLVLGDYNYYDSFGSIVAGWDNVSQAPYASTLGGRSNRAEAAFSSIVGGAFNVADGSTSAILGGNANRASDIDAVVCGGSGNQATARFSVVGGGTDVIQEVEFGWSAGSFGTPLQGAFTSP